MEQQGNNNAEIKIVTYFTSSRFFRERLNIFKERDLKNIK